MAEREGLISEGKGFSFLIVLIWDLNYIQLHVFNLPAYEENLDRSRCLPVSCVMSGL